MALGLRRAEEGVHPWSTRAAGLERFLAAAVGVAVPLQGTAEEEHAVRDCQ